MSIQDTAEARRGDRRQLIPDTPEGRRLRGRLLFQVRLADGKSTGRGTRWQRDERPRVREARCERKVPSGVSRANANIAKTRQCASLIPIWGGSFVAGKQFGYAWLF